jgi:hypothetical protein
MENTSTAIPTNYPVESDPAQITEAHMAEIKKHIKKKKLHWAESIIRGVLPPTCPPKGNFGPFFFLDFDSV